MSEQHDFRPHPVSIVAFLAAVAVSIVATSRMDNVRGIAAAAWLPTVVLAATAVSVLYKNGYTARAALVAGMYLPVTGLLVYLLLLK